MRTTTHWKRGAVIVGGLAILLITAACIGFWNTPAPIGQVIVGDVVVVGTQGTVLIAVADMPGGGLASIQFGDADDPAIVMTNIDPATVQVEGRNGFVITAENFDATGGSLIALNMAAVERNEILKFTFRVGPGTPEFDVDASKVTLGSDGEAPIALWDLSTPTYYGR